MRELEAEASVGHNSEEIIKILKDTGSAFATGHEVTEVT